MIDLSMISAEKRLSVCFTGPRPAKLPDGGNKKSAAVIEIGRRLEQAVLYHIAGGKTVFLNGCMAGIDVGRMKKIMRPLNDWAFTIAIWNSLRFQFYGSP